MGHTTVQGFVDQGELHEIRQSRRTTDRLSRLTVRR